MERYEFDDKDQFAEDILKMLERGSPNDVKIKCEDGHISANKDILMARSEYFATMFSNNKFIEGETSTVDMTHCSKVVMEKIIKLLFIGTVVFDDLGIIELLELSHMAKMMLLNTKFQDQVDNYVKTDIVGEICDIAELTAALKCANQFNLKNMEDCIIPEIINELNYEILDDDECSCSYSLTSLPFNLIRSILLFDLSSISPSKLPSISTKTFFDAFVIWLSENEATEEQKDEIVKSFNFEDFTVNELLTSVRKSGLYTISRIDERVLDLFNEQEDLVQHQRNLHIEKDKVIKDKDTLLKNQGKLLLRESMIISDKNREIKRLRSLRLEQIAK